jgi:2'-5' RNA ligase
MCGSHRWGFESPSFRSDTERVHRLLSLESVDRMLGREAHTGGMVALVPTAEDAERLALPGWEPADVLHVTLFFLGDTGDTHRDGYIDVGKATSTLIATPIVGNLWASAAFNPTGEDPCAAYLVGGADLDRAHRQVIMELLDYGSEGLPEQHQPWIPHITIGYGLDPAKLQGFGPVTFDRLRVAFGEDDVTDFVFPLDS